MSAVNASSRGSLPRNPPARTSALLCQPSRLPRYHAPGRPSLHQPAKQSTNHSTAGVPHCGGEEEHDQPLLRLKDPACGPLYGADGEGVGQAGGRAGWADPWLGLRGTGTGWGLARGAALHSAVCALAAAEAGMRVRLLCAPGRAAAGSGCLPRHPSHPSHPPPPSPACSCTLETWCTCT